MTARTDKVASISNSRENILVATECDMGERALIAAGHLSSFRCCYGARAEVDAGDGQVGLAIDSRAADTLDVKPGDRVWSVAR